MCLFFENNDHFSYVVNSYIYYFVHDCFCAFLLFNKLKTNFLPNGNLIPLFSRECL